MGRNETLVDRPEPFVLFRSPPAGGLASVGRSRRGSARLQGERYFSLSSPKRGPMLTRRFLHFLSMALQTLIATCAIGVAGAHGQGLGGAGTLQGTVKDPTGGVMQAVEVRISNPLSGFTRTTTTDAAGKYAFSNLAPNPYHVSVAAQGFKTLERDVDVRSGVPITVDLALALEGAATTVDVVGHAEDLLERDPTAPTDIDQSLMAKLPLEASSGLNQVITLASPGVVADSNGFFHPIGDHAQTQFSIDNH